MTRFDKDILARTCSGWGGTLSSPIRSISAPPEPVRNFFHWYTSLALDSAPESRFFPFVHPCSCLVKSETWEKQRPQTQVWKNCSAIKLVSTVMIEPKVSPLHRRAWKFRSQPPISELVSQHERKMEFNSKKQSKGVDELSTDTMKTNDLHGHGGVNMWPLPTRLIHTTSTIFLVKQW